MAINNTVDDGDITSGDLEDTDLANVDGFSGVAQEQDIASRERRLHTLTVANQKFNAGDTCQDQTWTR